MSAKNSYINALFALLKEKQALAYDEFKNTDLNHSDKFDEIEKWFEKVKYLIVQNPPKYNVKYLDIYENVQGSILRIEYEYCEKTEEFPPSMRVVAELV